MGLHIGFEHLLFKSRREEWSVRIWRDVKYKRPKVSNKLTHQLTPVEAANLIPDGEGTVQ